MDAPESNGIFPDSPDGVRGLRDQAAACRRLAAQARTIAGTTSMTALAEHFDEQARRLNLVQPISGTEVSAAGQEVAK